ncbi:hypothetical protein EVAR_90606_1 [Eumeta japonica]|uniref:Uncharacterized protein n=1 Tax=Eumeta variegata TaxID=151549 RepID=A0A4C1YQW9_EUMVA|nr:hypothetical protein EVAR_90606_1 [Eumeta japonica]
MQTLNLLSIMISTLMDLFQDQNNISIPGSYPGSNFNFELDVPHSENFPVPSNPKQKAQGQLPLSQISSNSGDSEFVITSPSVEPHLINSEEFDDLVRDLNLPKLKAEILGSRLKQWNLLKNDVIISDQKTS